MRARRFGRPNEPRSNFFRFVRHDTTRTREPERARGQVPNEPRVKSCIATFSAVAGVGRNACGSALADWQPIPQRVCVHIKMRIISEQAIPLDFPTPRTWVTPYGFENNLVVKHWFNIGSHSISSQNRLNA